MGDGGSAEFITIFYIVFTELPGDVIDEVPVAVDTLARIGFVRTDLGKAADIDNRHAEIVGIAVVRSTGADGVEADGKRIEAVIFREKTFGETIPAEAGLIDGRGGQDGNIRDGDELNASGDHGVVVRERPPPVRARGKSWVLSPM